MSERMWMHELIFPLTSRPPTLPFFQVYSIIFLLFSHPSPSPSPSPSSTHPLLHHQHMYRAVRETRVTRTEEQQMLIIVVDVATTCYLMYRQAKKNNLHTQTYHLMQTH